MHEGSELVIADWLASIEPFFHSPRAIADQSKQKMEHIYVLVLFSMCVGPVASSLLTACVYIYACMCIYIRIHRLWWWPNSLGWRRSFRSPILFVIFYTGQRVATQRRDVDRVRLRSAGPAALDRIPRLPNQIKFFVCFFYPSFLIAMRLWCVKNKKLIKPPAIE